MKSRNRHRVAALLALFVGLLTVAEGGLVLFGLEAKPYPVLPWLLRYNVAMGFISLGAGHGLWRERRWAGTLSRVVLLCHGLVFLGLVGMHLAELTVAQASIRAMLLRTLVWSAITIITRSKASE